eukprot:GGOE01019086.1.p1 GENE.GGOE01019086.1~~GGOE01019086.1.p1  ORF type:complete len:350 (-),score=79.81 GGOE01019086.1:106-1155(-)
MPQKKLKGKESFHPDDVVDRQFEPLRPSFTNTPFVKALLTQGKECVDVWPEQIALALGLNNHYISLCSSILVDLHFTYLTFAVQNHFSAEKTLAFIEEQEQLRASILQEGDLDVEAIARSFKMHLLARTKPLPLQQPLVFEAETEDELDKNHVSPRLKEKTKAKPKEELKESGLRMPKKELQPEPVVYNVADVTSILDFTASGILQHHHLHRYVYHKEQERPIVSNGVIRTHIQTAAMPLPLQRAIREQEFIEGAALQKVQEDDEERVRLKEFEEQAEAERQAAHRRRAEEEARVLKERERAANQLNLSSEEAQALITTAAVDIEDTLNARRRRILERLGALEEKLGLL